jgi:ribonuclease HII
MPRLPASFDDLPLSALRALFSDADPPGERTIARLAADPRAGVRDLAERLRAQRAREAREVRRLRRLFAEERALRHAGQARVAGVDEVGMGPLAGPILAACVLFTREPRLRGLDDSKKLTRAERESLALQIRACADAVSIGEATLEEVDALNIYHAGLLAMRRAVEQLALVPDVLLVDARTIPGVPIPQRKFVRADAQIACVAAASIVAKVERDERMRALDASYPGYGFAANCGYATPDHLEALRRLGPSPVHRRSFAPVRQKFSQLELFE